MNSGDETTEVKISHYSSSLLGVNRRPLSCHFANQTEYLRKR
jgi:hypothetical protein